MTLSYIYKFMILKPYDIDNDKEVIHYNCHFIRNSIIGATQEEYAEYLGVTRNIINAIERGISQPSIQLLSAMHEKIGVDVSALIAQPISFAKFDDFFINQSAVEKLDKARTNFNLP